MINNYIYPEMIDWAFGTMDDIEINTIETVMAVETSLIGSILADDEKNITLIITECLYGKYIAKRLMDLPSINSITSQQIDNFIRNFAADNHLESASDAHNHFQREYMESINVDETTMDLWFRSG